LVVEKNNPDQYIIEAFVSHLREYGFPDLQVQEWPDTKKERDIDAIAGHFAIEHTSVDAYPNQRANDDWLMKLIGDIENEIGPSLPFGLKIWLPYERNIRKQDFERVRESLRNWIVSNASLLSDGGHDIVDPRIPFKFQVGKVTETRRPGLRFGRQRPDDTTFTRRVHEKLTEKANKLARYQDRGMVTILLVESEDFVLMSEYKVAQAIKEGFGDLPRGVNEIWYADNSVISFTKINYMIG
jgi:hypothetical protein